MSKTIEQGDACLALDVELQSSQDVQALVQLGKAVVRKIYPLLGWQDGTAEPPQSLTDAGQIVLMGRLRGGTSFPLENLSIVICKPFDHAQLDVLVTQLQKSLQLGEALPHGGRVTEVRASLRAKLSFTTPYREAQNPSAVSFSLGERDEVLEHEKSMDELLSGVKVSSKCLEREPFREVILPSGALATTVCAATKILKMRGAPLEMGTINRLIHRLFREDPRFKEELLDSRLREGLPLSVSELKANIYYEARIVALLHVLEERLGRSLEDLVYDWLNEVHTVEEIEKVIVPGVPNAILEELVKHFGLGAYASIFLKTTFSQRSFAAINSSMFVDFMAGIIDLQRRNLEEHCTPDDMEMMLRESFVDDLAERCGPLIDRHFAQDTELQSLYAQLREGAKLSDSTASKALVLVELYLGYFNREGE